MAWIRRLLFAAILVAVLPFAALAEPKDYVFASATGHVAPSPGVPITVQLIHAPTKKPITDAIILQSRLEMPMPGMAPMAAKIAPKGSDGRGGYQFMADLSMPGSWVLHLSAKVNGEAGTVTGSVPFVVGASPHAAKP